MSVLGSRLVEHAWRPESGIRMTGPTIVCRHFGRCRSRPAPAAAHFQISAGGAQADHEGPAIAPRRRRGGSDVPRRRGIHIFGRWQIPRLRQRYLRTAPIGGGIIEHPPKAEKFTF